MTLLWGEHESAVATQAIARWQDAVGRYIPIILGNRCYVYPIAPALSGTII
jgi:hypothetical protein